MQETKASKVDYLFNTSSVEQTINQLGGWATENNYNLAIYRKPGESSTLLIDSGSMEKVDKPIEELGPGFLLADYNGSAWHMNAELQVNLDEKNIYGTLDVPEKEDLPKHWNYYTNSQEQFSTTKEEYIKSVETGINMIISTDLKKVVPSKVKSYELCNEFSLANAFVKLCDAYPSAFVSIVSNKEFGTWLTATPEMLIDVNNEGIFKTMALAGTKKYNPEKSLHEVAWTDKEIEEQAMVSRYIINRLKEIRLREFIEEGPMTVRAANLTHLCTTFTVDTKATNFPNLGGVMLNLLHPTSAVCGMPKEPALRLIEDIEKHDRKFYTGYLGPVNLKHQTSIYVNLRCMELFEKKANLFAGAGVTAFSDPEKEWKETELKCNTLLNVIA